MLPQICLWYWDLGSFNDSIDVVYITHQSYAKCISIIICLWYWDLGSFNDSIDVVYITHQSYAKCISIIIYTLRNLLRVYHGMWSTLMIIDI